MEEAHAPLVYSGEIGLYAYLYEQSDRYVLFLTNANEVSYPAISFAYRGFSFGRVEAIRKNGSLVEVP